MERVNRRIAIRGPWSEWTFDDSFLTTAVPRRRRTCSTGRARQRLADEPDGAQWPSVGTDLTSVWPQLQVTRAPSLGRPPRLDLAPVARRSRISPQRAALRMMKSDRVKVRRFNLAPGVSPGYASVGRDQARVWRATLAALKHAVSPARGGLNLESCPLGPRAHARGYMRITRHRRVSPLALVRPTGAKSSSLDLTPPPTIDHSPRTSFKVKTIEDTCQHFEVS